MVPEQLERFVYEKALSCRSWRYLLQIDIHENFMGMLLNRRTPLYITGTVEYLEIGKHAVCSPHY